MYQQLFVLENLMGKAKSGAEFVKGKGTAVRWWRDSQDFSMLVSCRTDERKEVEPYRACQRLPLGGKVGRRNAGSDEGEPEGFHGVGNSPTGPRWQRNSTTPRHYEIAPSSVTFGDSFPPRGSLRAMLRWGDYYGSFLQ